MDSCQANTGSDKLYKITLYVLRVLDINDRYLGCIVVLAQHDPLWNIGSTIYEHLVSVSGYREPTLRSSRKGKRGAPDSITGGPLTMSEIGPRAYCEMCAKYMGRSNSRDTTIDELSEYIDWANCPYHPVNVLTLENAVKQFRSLVDNPDELPLLKHEFITLQDVRSLLHFPAKQAWRVRSTAMDWGTFSSLFPWIENTDELNADIQKLLIMNSRGEGDREQRRRDPLEMISARAAMEQAHNTTQLARMNKMAPSLLRAANATTTTSTTTTSSKTKCPSEPAAALSWAVRKRSIFLEERAHKDKFTASAMEALTTIGQNTRWFPGLPRYLHPAMQWLRATSQSQSLCSVVNSNSTGDSSKRDLNMLLDKLVMRVNSKNAPLIRGLDEFASYVMYCFFGMPGKIGIPLHLSVGYMLATLGKYSAYRPDDMGTNILFVCGPDAGKSDILNHTLSSCMPDTASAEATRSLRADCSGENNNGLIEVSHDVKLEAWTGKLPEQKTKLTENQLDHKYLEVKEDGTRHTVKLVTRMRIACICATDMEFAIDKSIVTRVHLYFVPRVDINNSTNFKRKRDSKEEKMFNSIFQLQHCLYVLGTCYVQSTGNLVSTTLTELILDDFCRELKARRQVSVNMEARFRTRVRNSAYTSAILNANQIVFGKHGITGQLPTPDITIPEMRYIVPYAHDSLQIAICSISSVIEEICNPLNYYVLLALMAMAGFPALEYVTGKSTLASILRTNALNAANSAKEGAHRRVKWHRVAANEGLTSVGTVDKNAQYKIDPNFLHLDGDLQQLCPQIGAIMQQFLAPHVLFDGPVIYAILVGLQNIHVRINNYATLYDSAAKQLEPNSELQLVDNLTTTDVKCLQVVEKAAYKKPHVLISIEAINRICRLSDFTDYVTTRLPFAKVAPRRLFTMLMDYGRKTPPSTVATSSTITAATPGSYPLSMKNLIFIDFLADPSRQSITFNGAVPMAEELMLVDDDISADDSAAASTSSTSSSSSSAHADLDITASTNAAVTISEDYDHWVHFEHCRNNFISWDTAKRSWEYIQTLRKRTALSTTDIEAMQVAQTIAPLVSGSVIVNDSPGAAEEAPAATANQTDIDEVLHDEQ